MPALLDWIGALVSESDDAGNAGGKKFQVEVGVSFVTVFAREDLALLCHADGSGQGTFGKSAEEPPGGASSAADGSAPTVKELRDDAFFLAGCGHRFLSFENAPLRGKDPRILVGVRVAHHGRLHARGMRPHDGKIFRENVAGGTEVFAGFKKWADRKTGAPFSI